ncbi:MAG: hypothetical protein WBE18_08620 [Gammaproteobacteria bacterium]
MLKLENPDNKSSIVRTHLLLADCCHGDKDFEAVKEHAGKACDHDFVLDDPNLIYLFNTVAYNLLSHDDYEVAELLCQQALKLTNPKKQACAIDFYLTLAFTYLRWGHKNDQAIKYTEQACQMVQDFTPEDLDAIDDYQGEVFEAFERLTDMFEKNESMSPELVRLMTRLYLQLIKLHGELNYNDLSSYYGWWVVKIYDRLILCYYSQALLKEADDYSRKQIKLLIQMDSKDLLQPFNAFENFLKSLSNGYAQLSRQIRNTQGAQALYDLAARIFKKDRNVTIQQLINIYDCITKTPFSFSSENQAYLQDLKDFMQLLSKIFLAGKLPESGIRSFLQDAENLKEFQQWERELNANISFLHDLISEHPSYLVAVGAKLIELEEQIYKLETENTLLKNENQLLKLKRKSDEETEQDSPAEQGSSKKRKITVFFESSNNKTVSSSTVSEVPEVERTENSTSASLSPPRFE